MFVVHYQEVMSYFSSPSVVCRELITKCIKHAIGSWYSWSRCGCSFNYRYATSGSYQSAAPSIRKIETEGHLEEFTKQTRVEGYVERLNNEYRW